MKFLNHRRLSQFIKISNVERYGSKSKSKLLHQTAVGIIISCFDKKEYSLLWCVIKYRRNQKFRVHKVTVNLWCPNDQTHVPISAPKKNLKAIHRQISCNSQKLHQPPTFQSLPSELALCSHGLVKNSPGSACNGHSLRVAGFLCCRVQSWGLRWLDHDWEYWLQAMGCYQNLPSWWYYP